MKGLCLKHQILCYCLGSELAFNNILHLLDGKMMSSVLDKGGNIPEGRQEFGSTNSFVLKASQNEHFRRIHSVILCCTSTDDIV
jgi:anthranilate/para-aminobenzoate synthase component II